MPVRTPSLRLDSDPLSGGKAGHFSHDHSLPGPESGENLHFSPQLGTGLNGGFSDTVSAQKIDHRCVSRSAHRILGDPHLHPALGGLPTARSAAPRSRLSGGSCITRGQEGDAGQP